MNDTQEGMFSELVFFVTFLSLTLYDRALSYKEVDALKGILQL